MKLPDFIDGAVLAVIALMMLAPLILYAALTVKRKPPKDWLPCEAWIVVGIVALAWALKAAE